VTTGPVVTTFDLPAHLKPRLSQGHPWIYRNQVPGAPGLPSGSAVRVWCGGFTSFGLWDADSQIAIRLFSRHGPPDAVWVAARVEEAWATRASIRETPTTAYRWLYGESDGLPGVVVDLYGDVAVIQTFTESVDTLVPWVADALHAHTGLVGILWRRRGEEPRMLWGRRPPPDLVVEEHGLLFHADVWSGQKTGLYLDQRENRRTLAAWCCGKSVLDCFCYAGSFALYAARAGAATITAVDQATHAVDAARSNFRLNDLDPNRHDWLTEDCFEALESLAGEGRRFEIVILDPPSFARDRPSRLAAERAYVRLNRLALACVEPGGLLASASCTSQVSPDSFRTALAEAGRQAGRRLLTVHNAGQAVDHPVPAFFPEARYLKFVVSRVLPLV
jgi:23S rRNA (cytosine1962-C5)-methyltransferase